MRVEKSTRGLLFASATWHYSTEELPTEERRTRVVTGLVVGENEASLTIQTANEKVIIPKNEIGQRTNSNVSMMPDGMLQQLSSQQLRDLIAYLRTTAQVN